jgi:hypothetical protein
LATVSDNLRDNRTLTDYYRPQFTWRWLWKHLLAAVTLMALGITFAINQTNLAGRHSPGLLAHSHAIWETQCNACHGPPASGNIGSWATATFAFDQVQSERCRHCHAGPPHHAKCQGFEAECATCHREHRGRDASLVRVADEHCTRCHASLKSFMTDQGASLVYADHVGQFTAEEHPRFRSVAADPGKLLFNHALHMTPGMVLTPGAPPWRLDQIPQQLRERYRQKGQGNNDAVRLDCASCHQLDSEDLAARPPQPLNELWLPRSPGAYLLPVVYELHCQACHPLTFDRRLPDLQVPHRLQPDAVHRHLEDLYAAAQRRANAKVLDKPMPPPSVRAEVERAERFLFLGRTGCGECHLFAGPGDGVVPGQVVPTAIPAVWLEHASFNHTAHRALQCQVCHPRADPRNGEAEASRVAADVLIPQQEICLTCHAAQPGGGNRPAAARSDCTECHRYHLGDNTRAGVGAKARDPENRKGVPVFLGRP